jgi:hypothetical protein
MLYRATRSEDSEDSEDSEGSEGSEGSEAARRASAAAGCVRALAVRINPFGRLRDGLPSISARIDRIRDLAGG